MKVFIVLKEFDDTGFSKDINVFSNIIDAENLFWTVKSTYIFPDETFVVALVVLLLVVEVVVCVDGS